MRTHGHVARTAAALASAMGIGRFVYTPILPLMSAQAGLTAHDAAALATANYVGYLAGALAGSIWPRLARSITACRVSLPVMAASLAAMPLSTNTFEWAVLRGVAGFTSALVFVIAVNTMLEHLHGHPAHLAGWGFGGVGAGIALSAVLVLAAGDWKVAWWAAAAAAALLGVGAWSMPAAPHSPSATPADDSPPAHGPFTLLLTSYTLEGIGYIIAGTFLVAAVAQGAPAWLGGSTWLVVGLATVPSAALWAALSSRWSHPALLVAALALQAVGIAVAGMVGGVTAALVGAVLFGGTFIGVSTLALAAGRLLRYPRAVALLTTGYSVGQILGPLVVAPLLHRGFAPALLVGALVVSAAAVVSGVMRIVVRHPDAGDVQTEITDATGELVDDGEDSRAALVATPHQRPRP
ncbi:MFS transporter [Mycolicibacterium conceptionense]|nr:MFS transporter [Mycolicibacterium conceptionense]OMB81640.1 MFS transporter [Mycolicibacterium conceptionense]OMB84813.1 MFS transporter [Mycolicibacterium conceptionense]